MATRRAPRSVRAPRSRVERPSPNRPWILFVVLALVTLAAYQPAWHGGVLWDDDAHLTVPTLTSWTGLVRIWSDFTATQQYYPIVNSAFWAMHRLWGYDTFGYHIVNILLHAGSAWLVVGILRRFAVPGAVLAGVIFALHPVHVESVAWMTELKNTLSGVFYLLAAVAYLRFDENRDRRFYAAALIAFAFALGSKTVTATFPAAMLVIFWWRRGAFNWKQDVVPLLPFFAAGIAAGIGTAWLEYAWVGAKGDSFDLTFVERTLLAGRAVWFYAGKVVWPVGLIFMYPRWSIDQAVWWQYLFPIALAAALAVLWSLRSRTRAPLAAALFYCGTLFPALGFVNVFPFRYSFVADHFQYLASLGVIAMVAACLVLAARRWRPGVSEHAIAVAVGVPLFLLTFQQSRQYVSADTLYRATLVANPASLLARNNLSSLLLDGPSDGWAEAAEHANEAVKINPRDATAHNNVGVAWQRVGAHEKAVPELREAIRLNPGMGPAHYNLAISLAVLGQLDEAASAYEASLKISPTEARVLHNLAKVLVRLGRVDEGLARAREAARSDPASADIQLNLANTLALKGSLGDAVVAYREAIRLRGDWGEAQNNLAMVLWRAGRPEEAVAAFTAAVRLMPGEAGIHARLASLLASMKRFDEAVPRFEEAIRLAEPARSAEMHHDLGIVLVLLGRVDAAIPHFEAAIRVKPDFAAARDSLARARRR